MKDLKMSAKLIFGFLVVIVMAIFVGGVGIFGMSSINSADDRLYNFNLKAVDAIGSVNTNYSNQRAAYRDFIIYEASSEQFQKSKTTLAELEKEMEVYFTEYEATITEPDDRERFNSIKDIYHGDFKDIKDRLYQLGSANNQTEALSALMEASKIVSNLTEIVNQCYEYNILEADKAVDNNTSLFMVMAFIEIGVLVLAIILAMYFALHISALTSKPASFMKDVMQRIGTEGNLLFSADEYRQIEKYAESKDEIGQSVNMMLTMVRRLVKIGEALETVANGDLTADVSLLSQKDTMGLSLTKMIDGLNSMFSEIHSSTEEVSSASSQIADGAQTLAQGSTEQASVVQQLSASISEVADKTNRSAGIAREAAELSNSIKDNAEKGSHQMENMMQAVRDITNASSEIQKVIKVIDEIAFQTNILALNAAVEAARAGEAGKGFAVVADEVRNLAAKSAEAARETGGLIENSVGKANLGLNIATETSASLSEIVEGIKRSADIILNIAQMSDEQAGSISQINSGIDQVAQVVQQNSATAEQSAAASEEMNGQAGILESLIARFKLKAI